MAAIEADLAEHVGGNPSTIQRHLIRRAAMLSLRLHLMDRMSLTDAGLSERQSRYYLAWSGALSRILLRLNDTAPASDKSSTPSLNDYLLTTRANSR